MSRMAAGRAFGILVDVRAVILIALHYSRIHCQGQVPVYRGALVSWKKDGNKVLAKVPCPHRLYEWLCLELHGVQTISFFLLIQTESRRTHIWEACSNGLEIQHVGAHSIN